MRLKKLELYGFKSFATRTEIIFGEGITGIVGPNGSGKSNIGDAVRWVLGEQSAKTLRGASMSDIIFNGTQKRKPLGYCEVSLVFDNDDRALPMDFAEIMVTRRVYRNGDSEYFLNQSSCRLKDIIDLFRTDPPYGKNLALWDFEPIRKWMALWSPPAIARVYCHPERNMETKP